MSSPSSKVKQNKNGGYFVNGKSLPLDVRREIVVRRFIKGEKVTQIARSMKLTHGVVSKITQQFSKTGSYLPKNFRAYSESAYPSQPNPTPSPSSGYSSSTDTTESSAAPKSPSPTTLPLMDSLLDKTVEPKCFSEPETPTTSTLSNPTPTNAVMSSFTPIAPLTAPQTNMTAETDSMNAAIMQLWIMWLATNLPTLTG